MYKPVENQVDYIAQELEVLRFWEEQQIFEKLRRLRKDSPRWSFIDGPITANNPMGVHHGWGRMYKDLFHRFKAMQGFQSRYQNGFDCQGLWVEVEVERAMGFKSKRDIEEFGLAKFVLLCKQRVLEQAATQTEQSKRLGYWMDWDDPEKLRELSVKLEEDPYQEITFEGPSGPYTRTVEQVVGHLGMKELGGSYFTFSDENNYTIWQALKSCYDRGWIYKGRDVMPWCGRCGTGLSQHEIVTEGYQELTHPSITVRFPLLDRPGESLLVWTTTPWTLTSNVAAAVGPELTYVKVRQGEETFYLSRGALNVLQGEYRVEGELTGEELEGWRYKGPFDELPAQVSHGGPEAHQVILWEEVGEEEGTGIVHIAPGAGSEDYALGLEYSLPVIAPLDDAGIFEEGFDWLTGMGVGDTAQPIFEDLKEKGLAYRSEQYTHRYPVCWRCGEELVFRLVDEWFISMGEQLDKSYEGITEAEKETALRYQIMEVVVEGTKWYPAFGYERELEWLRNMQDWMISKKRYWGLALPIYECHACGNFEVIGSKQELEERAVEGWEDFEGHTPHRPFIDAVKIACSECGAVITRIPDVGNPWLDAGVVAMSTLRYGDDKEYWRQWFPADFISESFPGQFRNWFYSLLAMSTILEREAPFRNVFTYATLLAEDGRAMHKSWGNMIEFNQAANQMGVDVMRWLYSDHKPEQDLLFGYHKADEVRRQFLIPLWNVYSFFVTYANIDSWSADDKGLGEPTMLDRWILARLAETVQKVTVDLESFQPNSATETLHLYLEDLSNWYLRRSRRRFWVQRGKSPASDAEKQAAYETMYTVLLTLAKLLAPFVPFVSEVIYQNLGRTGILGAPESVHHCAWPEVVSDDLDPALTSEMELVKRLVSLGHAARNKANRKLRQPLAEAAMAVGSEVERAIVLSYRDLIEDELNVKSVRLLDAVAEAANYILKPLPKQLGQKYGSRFPAIKAALESLEPGEAARTLLSGGSIAIVEGEETMSILPEEVEIRVEAQEGFAAAAEGPYLTALVTGLTEDLKQEGLVRDVVRRVQDLRRKAGFNVDDRIRLEYSASAEIEEAIQAFSGYLKDETLASELLRSDNPVGTQVATDALDQGELTIGIATVGSR